MKRAVEAARAGEGTGRLGNSSSPSGADTSRSSGLEQMVSSTRAFLADASRAATSGDDGGQPEAAAASSTAGPSQVIEKQQAIAAKKRRFAVTAVAGSMPEFVGPRGEVWRAPKRAKTPGAHHPLTGSGSLSVCLAPASGINKSEVIASLAPRTVQFYLDPRHCSLLVVDSLADRLSDVLVVEARLHGRSVADAHWIRTQQREGQRVSFRSALNVNRQLKLSPKFIEGYPGHVKVLEKAVEKRTETGLRVCRCSIHAPGQIESLECLLRVLDLVSPPVT